MQSLGFRVVTCLVAAGGLAGAGGCSHPPGKVPVTIPVYNFEPPDREDVFPDEAEQGDDEDAAPAEEHSQAKAPAPEVKAAAVTKSTAPVAKTAPLGHK